MRLLALLVGLLFATPALAQTTWTGPYTNTTPIQAGTVSCSQPNDTTLICTPTPAILPPLSVPVVTPATFTVPKPVSADQLIGTVAVSNGPIATLNIVSGDTGNPTLNPPGYFAIYAATMHLRTSEVIGAQLPPTGTYNLMLTAINTAGVSSAPAAITVIVP